MRSNEGEERGIWKGEGGNNGTGGKMMCSHEWSKEEKGLHRADGRGEGERVRELRSVVHSSASHTPIPILLGTAPCVSFDSAAHGRRGNFEEGHSEETFG